MNAKRKTIYVVTHGSKSRGANPPMTEVGFDEIRALRALLPDNPPEVVCAGRPSMIMIGEPGAKNAAVYALIYLNDQFMRIDEVVATGVSEIGTV